MKLIGPPTTKLLQFLTEYVTWPCDLDVWYLDTWCHFSGQRLCQVWDVYTVLDRVMTIAISIDRQLKVPIFTFFWRGRVKGSNFKFHRSNPQKALPWWERRIMTYWALGCVQRCDLWAWLKRGKKDRNFRASVSASNWLFAQTTTSTYPLKFCMWGRVLELVIYFKFHENRSRGLGAVGGRKSPSSIDKAHGLYNSLYYRYKPWYLEQTPSLSYCFKNPIIF